MKYENGGAASWFETMLSTKCNDEVVFSASQQAYFLLWREAMLAKPEPCTLNLDPI